jgi:hypothetical protein
MLSFHALRGKNYAGNISRDAVELLEDGKPRAFTIFDSPATLGRMPLELVLLFDTNPKINYFWDPTGVFRFIPTWGDAMSQTVLEKGGAGVRVSIYHCALQKLYRSSPATTNPEQITSAFRDLLKPELEEPGTASAGIRLTLPPRREHVAPGPFTDDYVTSPFVSAGKRGWPMEAAIAVLNEMAAAEDKVSRVLVMFSEGIGATTTIPEDVGEQALDLGIPIYPIVTNYEHHIRSGWPRNLFRMRQFGALGKMTGGRELDYPKIDSADLINILETVKNDGLQQYVVGFVPPANSAPKTHTLDIRLKSKAAGKLEGGKRRAVY